MRDSRRIWLLLLIAGALLMGAAVLPLRANDMLKVSDIGVRDPFIYVDQAAGTYYLYAQMGNRLDAGDKNRRGVEVYTSKDLQNWTRPQPVLTIPEKFWARKMVWAPEVHKYKGKFYMFVTLTSDDKLTNTKRPEGVKSWPPFYKRGTHVFWADSPSGPFKPFVAGQSGPHTPAGWMALDGTLYVEKGVPYMVFCHEWVQVQDGAVAVVKLKPDLSSAIGEPQTLFKASDAKWVNPGLSKVTDGPFLYRTGKGKLLMIWSSFGKGGYQTGIAVSQTGKLAGPWKQQEKLLFDKNGGHGMIFRSLDNKLMLALHRPNSPARRERLAVFELEDTGDSIRIKRQIIDATRKKTDGKHN